MVLDLRYVTHCSGSGQASAGAQRSSAALRFAQALAVEFDPVCVVDDAVEDGVGQRRVADDLVPVVDRHLAGDDQRAGAVAILDDLQQIARCSASSGSGPQSSMISRSTRASWRSSLA